MNWLILLFAFEIGFAPTYDSENVVVSENSIIINEDIFYTSFEVEAIIYDYLFVGGSVKTYVQDMKLSKTFYPFELDSFFNAGLRYKNIELGFKHFCLHPVRPYEMYYEPQGSNNAAYEEFYIRIEKRM